MKPESLCDTVIELSKTFPENELLNIIVSLNDGVAVFVDHKALSTCTCKKGATGVLFEDHHGGTFSI